AVLVLGLVGALVDGVGDAVAIVIGIGAAVLVLEAVLVLGLVRALVGGVGDAVAIVVGVGAAVLGLEAVLVLGLVRAFVGGADDAVLGGIVVDHRGRRLGRLGASELLVDREQRLEVLGESVVLAAGREQEAQIRAQAPAVVDAVLGADADVEQRVGIL